MQFTIFTLSASILFTTTTNAALIRVFDQHDFQGNSQDLPAPHIQCVGIADFNDNVHSVQLLEGSDCYFYDNWCDDEEGSIAIV
jgi:hypothetical protein